MTGAATVVWFLGRKPKETRPAKAVKLAKPSGIQEAHRAVAESAARNKVASKQRGLVERTVASLVEIRKANHLAENINRAMGGDK